MTDKEYWERARLERDRFRAIMDKATGDVRGAKPLNIKKPFRFGNKRKKGK